MQEEVLHIDGNYLEGGGQIVRTALALSTILKKPFTINNIRKGRQNSGLKHQHLYCIKALEELCNATAKGAEVGSTYLEFTPNNIQPKNLNIDIGTAGSITLLLQAILLPCLFAEKKTRIKIHGGTDTKWAMPFDYFKEVFIPQLRRFCNAIEANLIKRGYYPKGNGHVEIIISPKYILSKFNSIDKFISKVKSESKGFELIEQAHLIQIKGVSHASMGLQKAEVSERQARIAKQHLSRFNCPVNIRTEYSATQSIGSGITLWAIFSKDKDEISYINPIMLGGDALGEKGKKAEIVGKEAAEKLEKEIISRAPVDSHLADNLMPYLGLFGGAIKASEITKHTLTNIYVTERFFSAQGKTNLEKMRGGKASEHFDRFLGKRFNIDEENKIISVT